MRLKMRVITAAIAGVAVTGLMALMTLTGGTEPQKAWAQGDIDINPGNVPTTAADFQNECNANEGGGPFPNEDVWVFVLPGNDAGDFISVTADFGPNGIVSINTTDDPDNFSNTGMGTSKAWIITPAGWTLENATADITGEAEFFNLTHTCPASGGPSPSPSVSPSRSVSPSPSVSPSRSVSPSPSRSVSPSPSRSVTPSPSRSVTPSPSRSPRPTPSRTGYGY